MATTDQPITRTELRYELRHYSTKADLERLKADLTLRMAMLQLGGMATTGAIVAAIIRFLD